jgi:hypothetical protein
MFILIGALAMFYLVVMGVYYILLFVGALLGVVFTHDDVE